MPPSNRIEGIREPWLEITIIVPDTYLGGVIGLVQ
jgi:translation elongation factor EF-4